MMRAAVFLGVLVLTGCGHPADTPAADATAEAASEGVHLDAETQARMGVRAAPLAASSAAQTAEGFARVMDVGSLAAIESEVGAAEAAASASQEEYRRLAALVAQDQAASARSVEAAKAQAAADAARAKLAARRIGLEWGAGLERMPDGERSHLLSDIASGKAALLRIDSPNVTGKIVKASVKTDKDSAAIPITIIGQAAVADARLQTAGLLGLVRGDVSASLPAGRLLQADLELGAEEEGLLVPSSALIRSGGNVVVYVKTGADTFERRDVTAGRPVANGWFIKEGLAAGNEIVVDGAASLLAAEQGPVEAE